MAKKSKRSISAGTPADSTAPATTYTRPATAARPSYSTEFKPDYSLVISDLKRIGSLVAIFSVVLVALAFFLR
jgi:predicted component of viral defense system (DUF524 family)